MQRRTLRWLATASATVLMLFGVAALAAACGGDDDSGNNDSSSPAAKPANTQDAGKAADANGSAANPSGTDKEYVKDVCVAMNTYIDAFTKKFSADPTVLSDQDKMLKAIGPELEAFGKNLEKAKPPRDAAKFHEQMVKAVADLADRLKKGQIKSIQELGQFTQGRVDEPTQAVKQRLAAASKDVAECRNTGGIFGQ